MWKQSNRDRREQRCCSRVEETTMYRRPENVFNENFYVSLCDENGEPPNYYTVTCATTAKTNDCTPPPDYSTVSLRTTNNEKIEGDTSNSSGN